MDSWSPATLPQMLMQGSLLSPFLLLLLLLFLFNTEQQIGGRGRSVTATASMIF
jgi:hypothetical protein